MRHIAQDPGPFGRPIETKKKPRPRPIEARLEDVPLGALHRFIDDLGEAEFRFRMYKDGFVDLDVMSDGGIQHKREMLARDQVNTFLRGLIRAELVRRGAASPSKSKSPCGRKTVPER